MRINSACAQQHRGLGGATDRTELLSQTKAGDTSKGGQSHAFKMAAESLGRTLHEPQRKIGMCTWPAPIHERRFWRQFGFRDQGSNSELCQASGLALRITIILNQVADRSSRHYQLLNRAGGL
jgi:hypothetical protein